MKFSILAGSPRKNGNTAALLVPFTQALAAGGAEYSLISLSDKNICGCTACRTCQRDWTKFGCAIKDDVQDIFDDVLSADTLLLATPIYSWFCPAPMKALLDRLVYGMNKYYGDTKGPSLWAGKRMALLLTCGYRPENGADLFETGMRRYCKHGALIYAGSHAERDLGYNSVFMDEEKAARTTEFAKKLLAESDA
jgi:multimeric flavodoxin WrbA